MKVLKGRVALRTVVDQDTEADPADDAAGVIADGAATGRDALAGVWQAIGAVAAGAGALDGAVVDDGGLAVDVDAVAVAVIGAVRDAERTIDVHARGETAGDDAVVEDRGGAVRADAGAVAADDVAAAEAWAQAPGCRWLR